MTDERRRAYRREEDEPTTAEVRLLDAAEACRARQVSLDGALSRIEGQGVTHLGSMGRLEASMATVELAAVAVSKIATVRTLIVLAVLASLPTVAAGTLLLIILGHGGDLLSAAVSAAK